MRLLSFPSDTQLYVAEARVLKSLQDIMQDVQIQADFCIQHPHYLLSTLPDTAVARFNQLSRELQDQYLTLRLSTVLHDLYFVGSQSADEATEVSLEVVQNAKTMDQNWDFCGSLHTNNRGTGWFDPEWTVLIEASDGSLMVQKQGLTLHIQRDRHLQPTEQSPEAGAIVSVRMPSNMFEQGYYVAVGNAGLANGTYPPNNAGLLSVYFNLSSDGAIAVMAELTQTLNQLSIPFSFKVRYDPSDFHRYSTALLSCQPGHYSAIRSVLEGIYTDCQSYFRPEVPIFAKYLAPGLAIAEEPLASEHRPQPFGIHRCQIVASGLLAAWKEGDDTPIGRLTAIQHQFSVLGLAWQQPHLNVNSEDIYSFLD